MYVHTAIEHNSILYTCTVAKCIRHINVYNIDGALTPCCKFFMSPHYKLDTTAPLVVCSCAKTDS